MKSDHYIVFLFLTFIFSIMLNVLCFFYDMQLEDKMLRDQREREQLEKNLKEWDATVTRKVLI